MKEVHIRCYSWQIRFCLLQLSFLEVSIGSYTFHLRVLFFKRLGVYHQGGRNFSLRAAEAVRPQLWEPLQLLRDGKRPSMKGLPANMGIMYQ